MAETVNDYMETDLGNVAPNPQGDYSETAAYEYLDLVAYAGGSYMCIKEDGTVTGIAPTAGKTTEIWQEVSRPGDLTPEYVAMHDDVVNKAASVTEDAETVASDREQIEGMKENVIALQEQTAQDAEAAENSRESSAGFASMAEESRKAASASEENIRMLVDGFDTHVEEQKQAAEEDITASRQNAIQVIAAQQVLSTNAVKAEGEKAIRQTAEDAASTAADREAVTELAGTVSEQASKVAQDAVQTASDKAETATYVETAKESKEQAVAAADSVKDIVAQVQQNAEGLIAKAPVIMETVTSYAGEDVCVTDSAEMPLQGMKVYGKSWQVTTTGANLFNLTKKSETVKGITFEVRNDGTMHVSGTNDSGSVLYVTLGSFNATEGQKVIFSGFYSLENSDIETYIECDGKVVCARINADESNKYVWTSTVTGVVNIQFKVRREIAIDREFDKMMINVGDTVLPYEPYTGGKPSPSPEYPQEIQSAGYVMSTGKNLVKINDADAVTWGMSITVPESFKNLPSDNYVASIYLDLEETGSKFSQTDTYGFGLFDKDRKVILYNSKPWGTDKKLRFTIQISSSIDLSNVNEIIMYGCGNNSDGATGKARMYNFQLEKGNTPTDYEPYTGGVPALYQKDIEVELTGKNLFGGKTFAGKIVELGGSINENNKTVNIVASTVANKIVYEFPDSSKQYTILLSGYNTSETQTPNLRIAYSDGTEEGITNFVDGKKVIITNAEKKAVSLNGWWKTGNTFFYYEECGVFEGALTETDFEPYHEPQSLPITTPTGLPAIPVPSGTAGITYTDADGQAWIADEIDFERGKYIQRVWQMEFDGSGDENWRAEDSTKTYFSSLLPEIMAFRNGFANQYRVFTHHDSTQTNIAFGRKNKGFCCVIPDIFDTSLSDYGLSNWKAHLAEHPLKVMTYLDTPIETDLSEEQIQAYKAVHTNKPTTIFSNDAGAQMDVSYAIDTKTYIDNKFAELASAIVASASESE